jgi:geranylgeranyl pyrophosphate synthase
LSASDHNQDYTLNKNGLTIDIKNGENSKSITVTYDNSAKTRREEFVNFLNNIDDDVFVAICEDLGNLQEIQDLIDSDEHLEEGIAKFKEAAIDYLTNAKQNIEDLLDAFEEI